MDDKWIDSIRDKMVEYEVAPPDGILAAVQDKVNVLKTRRKRIFLAIAASIALIGVISMALIPNIEKEHTPMVSATSVSYRVKGAANIIAENIVMPVDTHSRPRSSGRVVATPSVAVDDPVSGAQLEINDDGDKSHENIDEYKDVSEETCTSLNRIENDNYNDKYIDCSSPVATANSPSHKYSPTSVGMAASANGMGGLFGDNNMESQPLHAFASMPHTRMGGGLLGDSNTANSPIPTFVEIFDHKLPVRASIDFSWLVYYNLHIGAGIGYSYLRSDIRYGYSDSPLFKASQSLHFLGIPVNVRYTPWSYRKLDVYVSAGFMVEKCLGGGIKTENSTDPGYSYAGCNDRPFQLSFSAAVGLQYSLVGRCAIFIEPGVGLYLKNGSMLRTIYSERPLTFNVNVGLRFGHLD